ncbi:hypothetical protein EDB86DRAFT_2904676 [Lactarius hatsudake]|nr:hypothetical protein EDB86DRAFT_2904676 [Lactarius hatsudake]
MIGDVWFKIPNYKQRGNCDTCNMMESMMHILLYCRSNSVDLIWELAKDLWPYDPEEWLPINLGLILGVGCLSYNLLISAQQGNALLNNECARRKKDEKKGASRLLQILISEAAHLVWVIRCERVIQERTHNPHKIRSRWRNIIIKRLTEDKIIATKVKKCDESAQLVEATWGKVLRKFSDPPYNWIHNCEVLVGSIVHLAWPIAGDAQ